MLKKYSLLVILLGSVGGLPTYFFLSSNAWLIILGILSLINIKLTRNEILFCFLLIFSIFLKLVLHFIIHLDFPPLIIHYGLPDLRLLIIILIIKRFSKELEYFSPFILIYLVALYLIFNVIGEISTPLYKELQFNWNKENLNYWWLYKTGLMTTISGHAAPHRLSGFFPLPSYAGIFSCIVFYISLYLIFIQKKNYFFLILIFICSLYFGFRSNSTIFLIGSMIIVFNLFFYSKFLKFKNLFYFISFLILLLIIFYVYNYGAKEEYVKFLFGGRFIENAKVSIFINNFTLSNFLFGANLNYIPYFVTDNMIAIRLYTFGFFITLLIYYLYFKSLRFIPNHNYNYVIFFILFLSEMGVRALGGPEVFFLFYVLSFYLNRFKKSLK